MTDTPSLSGCGADALSEDLYSRLTSDADFAVALPDLTGSSYQMPSKTGALYGEVAPLTNDALTTGAVDGEGTFDLVMRSMKAHLQQEFEKGRLTGDQYAKSYIEMTGLALQSSVQFLLGRDNARWQAVLVQSQAQAAQIAVSAAAVQLEIAKTTLATNIAQMKTAKAQHAVTKMQLSGLDVDYCIKKAQKDAAVYQVTDILPAQKTLLKEQGEAQRAQTMNTRSDGVTVVGAMGKQKDLYTQQIDAYKKDAEYKAGKMYLDAWITQKSLDGDGIAIPNELKEPTINTVLNKIRLNNGLA